MNTIGPYHLLEPLGEGGMGVVYRAVHTQTQQVVALKTIKQLDEHQLRSIRREIQSLARLEHPGIVRIIEEGAHDGVPWYAMQLIQGKTLRQWCAAADPQSTPTQVDDATSWVNTLVNPPLNEEEFTSWVRAMQAVSPRAARERAPEKNLFTLLRRFCGTLAFLHGEGIIHRDLKPENILVDNHDFPVLMDFGLANILHQQEEGRENILIDPGIFGTAHYMSPEQIQQEPLDARSDLYSLGVILFELFTHRRPFLYKNPASVMKAHILEAPPSPSSIEPSIPPELDALISSLLAKRREGRPGYALDVARVLLSLGAEDEPQRPCRSYLYRPKLAGRAMELSQLRFLIKGAEQAKGGLILILGESGVGKTRLVLEAMSESLRRGLRVLTGACQDVEVRPALSLLQSPLQTLMDRCLTKPEEAEVLFGSRGPLISQYAPGVRVLQDQSKHPDPSSLPPEAARLRLFSYLTETLLLYAKDRALLLLFDDLQWADELSLGFVLYLAELARDKKLLMIATHRSEEEGAHLARLRAVALSEVSLDKLPASALEEIACDMLSLSSLPKEFGQHLLSSSEGNPLFIREYLHLCMEEGLLSRDQSGRWGLLASTAEEFRRLPLPDSLRVLVQRRLQGLPSEARRLFDTILLIGKEANSKIAALASGLSAEELSAAQQELLRGQFIEEPAPSLLRIVHDKLREVGLAEMTHESARHRQIALALAAAAPEELGSLARHWASAGEPEQAKRYYLQAAQRAVRQYSLQEAEQLFLSYLSLVQEPTRESITARLSLGRDVLEAQAKSAMAILAFDAAYEEANKIGDQRLAAESLQQKGESLVPLGDPEAGRSLLLEALARHQENQDSSRAGSCLVALARCEYAKSQRQACREYYEQALPILQKSGDRLVEGIVIGELANLEREAGHFVQAIELFLKAIEIHRETGNQRDEGKALGNLAIVYHEQGQIEEAKRLYEQALQINRQVGNRRAEGVILGNLANLCSEQSLLPEAEGLYRRAILMAREAQYPLVESIISSNLANLLSLQGDLDTAEPLYQSSISILRKMGNKRFEGNAMVGQARLYHRRKDFESAERTFLQTISLLRETNDRYAESGAHFHLGELYFDLGRLEEAQEQWALGMSLAKEVNHQRMQGIILGVNANIFRILGRYEEAEEAFQESERLLLFVKDKLELAMSLCARGHLFLARSESAQLLLERAEALWRETNTGQKSELAERLRALQEAQRLSSEGAP